MKRKTKAVVLAAAGIALVPMLSGCWQGFGAATTITPPSGNGAEGAVGQVQLRSATLVRSTTTPTTASLVVNLINTNTSADALVKVTTVPTATVAITGGQVPLPPVSQVAVGQGGTAKVLLTNLNAPTSSYVNMTFSFKVAGDVTLQVLTVPPVGMYAPFAPGAEASPPPKSGIGNNPSANAQNQNKKQ